MPFPNVRTLQQLIQAGADSHLAFLMDQGIFGQEALARLRVRYPDALTNSLVALQRRVVQSRRIARAVERGEPVTYADCRRGIQNPGLASRVVYTLRLRWTDPDSGGRLTRTVQVGGSLRDDVDRIRQAAMDALRAQFNREGRRRSRRSPSFPVDNMDVEAAVVFVRCQ